MSKKLKLRILAAKSVKDFKGIFAKKDTERFTDLGKLNFPMVVRF